MTPFGKYFLLERINVGGMAEVYKAKTVGVEGFEKILAIKRILPSVAEDEEFIRMFVDEAKITSQLSHANLAQTFDLGKIDDTYYIAMEYVPGKDLRAIFERVKRRGERVPLPIAAWVMGRVCEGLDYAHRKRDIGGRELHIVHRDVSPQNIILSYEGEVKLIDFGIAKAANKITRTQAGILKGKFGYMSPEQVRGLPLDGRSDIFAAGVVLYELCTGDRLFTGSSDFSVLEKVQQARVTPPSQVEPSIPLELERIILKALAREADDRYQQAADMASDLTRFLLELQQRSVTRDDLSAFMRATFPEDERRRAEAPSRRPPPRISEPPRAAADKPPRAGDPERTITVTGPAPHGERAEIIVKSKLGPRSSPDLVEPGDSPTRPMRMNDLAAAEREYAQQRRLAPSVVLDDLEVTPVERPMPPPPVASEPLPIAAEPQAEEPDEVRLQDQKTQVRAAPSRPAPAPPAENESADSGLTRRARWARGVQIGIVGVALLIAAWALLSPPRRRASRAAGPSGTGSTLSRGEQKTVNFVLQAPQNPVVVLSSPPGAQVWVDGEKKGQTPAWIALLDPAVQHAISVEKTCYRAWQVALPPRSLPREVAATLSPAPGACPGSHLEATGMPAPANLPDDAAATATLGFLNLGSRPSAQVLIDGVDIGQTTPLLAWPLHDGSHQVHLVGKGGSKEVAVAIRTGETTSTIVDLSKPGAPPAKAAKKRRGRR